MALDEKLPAAAFEGPVYRPDAKDPFLTDLSKELADEGFFTTSSAALINWARTGSLMWMTFGEAKPIRGSAEIMRLTDPRHEQVHGVGVRFVSFEASDRLRLEMFIDRNLPPRSGGGSG